MLPESIIRSLTQNLGESPQQLTTVGGGSINECFRFTLHDKVFFLKYNSQKQYPDIIQCEQEGHTALASSEVVKTPDILQYEQVEDYEFLLLPFIGSGKRGPLFWRELGTSLAKLHDQDVGDEFGWSRTNYLGSLPQYNQSNTDFTDFWIHQRILPQLKWAKDAHKIGQKEVKAFEKLFTKLNAIFPSLQPSLVHGDLWSGNIIGHDEAGAYFIDPAIHYGHSETDLAFTHLFGSFEPSFYQAYQEIRPLAPGFQDRISIYNLYPLLLHLNLFGQAYLPSISSSLKAFQ